MSKKPEETKDPKKSETKKRFHGKRKSYKGKDEHVMDKREGGNDPRWWGPKPYVDAVSRFPYSNPLGQPIPWSFLNDPLSSAQITLSSDSNALVTVPGVMTIDVLPTMGICKYPVDPMNTYLRAFYSKLRSTNNQSAPYYAPDLGMYLMAIDSIHMGLEQLVRIYGIARTYSPLNRYLPVAMLQAMGINPVDATYNLFSNLANFRAKILALMVKVRTLNFPRGINFNDRHRSLLRYVYSDVNVAKSQTYLFRTPYLYKYNATYNSSGGGLEATAVPAFGSNAAAWISFVETLIDAVVDDTDFAIISGDIAKSFGYENLMTMEYLDELYSVVPVYNPEILLEIHNLKISGDRWDSTAFDIYQDASMNAFVCAPYCGTPYATAGPIQALIDVPIDMPDADTNMIATRLTSVGPYTYDSGSSKFKFVPVTLGTELVVGTHIWRYNAAGTLVKYDISTNVITTGGATVTYTSVLGAIGQQQAFDWHPHIYFVKTDSSGNMELLGVLSELSDYTIIEAAALTRINDVAMYGALTVTGLDTVGLKG